MDNSYYETLGLQPGADAKEVKRAYFRLVKQFSPEEHPEEFQRIRAAYERLTDPNRKEETSEDAISLPDTEQARGAFQVASACMNHENYQHALRIAELMLQQYGDSEAFLLVQAVAEKRLGHTGRAVKSFQRLTQLCPEKLSYRGQLAMAYYQRGYMKKALTAFQEAYILGLRDVDFLMHYAMTCQDRERYREGNRIFREVVELAQKDWKENLSLLLSAFEGWTDTQLHQGSVTPQLKNALARLVEAASLYLEVYEEDFLSLFDGMMMLHIQADNLDVAYIIELMKQVRSHLSDPEAAKQWDQILDGAQFAVIRKDDSFSDALVRLCGLRLQPQEEDDSWRFSELDARLCIMEEWPGNREQLLRLARDYPRCYKLVEEFHRQLEETKDIERLRSRMIQDYDRRSKQFQGTPFYDRYPNRRPRPETVLWKGSEGVYHRAGKKIGRNDPCPCGSGKKYKKCCGRNL
ncbi:MAG: DnaJ domain-containing protein [Clostridiales bacterium]|nr:DnaJ domain-containing protein [Clostridiales bacterium]